MLVLSGDGKYVKGILVLLGGWVLVDAILIFLASNVSTFGVVIFSLVEYSIGGTVVFAAGRGLVGSALGFSYGIFSVKNLMCWVLRFLWLRLAVRWDSWPVWARWRRNLFSDCFSCLASRRSGWTSFGWRWV